MKNYFEAEVCRSQCLELAPMSTVGGVQRDVEVICSDCTVLLLRRFPNVVVVE